MSGVGEAPSNCSVGAEIKTRRSTIVGLQHSSSPPVDSVGGRGGGKGTLAVTIEQSKAVQCVANQFGGSGVDRSAGADSSNSSVDPTTSAVDAGLGFGFNSSGRCSSVASCTLTLEHTSSRHITTTASPAAATAQPFGVGIEVVFGGCGQRQLYSHNSRSSLRRASYVDGMRSRRSPALKGLSAPPPKASDKLLAIKPKTEEKRADIPKKRASSSNRKKTIEPQIMSTNSACIEKPPSSCEDNFKESTQSETTVFNQLLEINENFSPDVEITAEGNKGAVALKVAKAKKPFNKKISKRSSKASRKSKQNKKAKKTSAAKPSSMKHSTRKKAAVVIDSNLILCEKFDFLTESQLENLRTLKILRPENLLNLSLRQLNSIGINKGEQLEAILSILDNGHKCREQKEKLQNAQIHQQRENEQIMPHDVPNDNDDDEEQALVIDETASAFQEIENITCSPDLNLSHRSGASDEDPIRFSNAIGEVEKSLKLIKNSNAPIAERKIQIESILNELNVIEEQYKKFQPYNNINNVDDINKDKTPQPPSPPLNEDERQKMFTFNLPTATSIFKLTDGLIIKDGKASNMDETKSIAPNVVEEPAPDAVKKMTLRSESKSAESQPPQEQQISTTQLTKKEAKEAKNKYSTVCNTNMEIISNNNHLNIITNPAAVILMNNQKSRDSSASKAVRKIVKYVRNGKNGIPIQVAKPIEFIDLVSDKSYIKTTSFQKSPLKSPTISNINPFTAKSNPSAVFSKNPSTIVTEPKNIIFINANKPYVKTDVLNIPSITLNASTATPKFIIPATEEKLNINLGEIRRNLVLNTLPNQKNINQFDSWPKLSITMNPECTQKQNGTVKSPHSITSSNQHEDQFTNKPEAFRFYSSQDSSTNSFSTTTRTILDEEKSSDEYQHAFNTFVHSEFNKNVLSRDSDSASSRSSDKTDLSNPRPFTSAWLLPSSQSITKNSNKDNDDGGAKVISDEIIVAAPLESVKKFDIAANSAASQPTSCPLPYSAQTSTSVAQEVDLRDYSNQLHCKELKQELDVDRINLTTVKLEKCTDNADSTTKSPQLIYKPKGNPFNKPSTAIRPILGRHLIKIKQELSEDADSTTRSPELTSNEENTTIKIKKERRVKEKFRETDTQYKEQQAPIQSKEKKIKLKRNFHIKRKDQPDAPHSSPKRTKNTSSASRQWLYSPTPSSSIKSSQESNKKYDKLTMDTGASLHHKQQQLQQRPSSGYSSSTSSSRVVYTHPKPSIDAAAPTSTHSSQSKTSSTALSVSMVMQQNERNDSHQIPNWQKKSDLRQKLENRRASISSKEIPKQYQQHRHHDQPPQQSLLSPKKELYAQKSYDEKEEGNYHKTLPDKDIESPAEDELDNKDKLKQIISHKANDVKSDTGLDELTIASPTFSPLSSVESASPASPKNSLSYYTSVPIIDGQMSYPPMLYMLSEIVIPKEVNEPPPSLLQIKTEDPRLSKYIKKNAVPNYSDLTISPARNDPRLRRSVQFSDNAMPQQQQQQQQQHQQLLFHKQHQQQQQQPQPQPNMVLYNCLQRSSWYQGLMSTMKIQINQCISELVRALNNFQKERQVDHTAVFDIFKIDCACELMEIMRSLCISIDMNGVITDQKNFFSLNGSSIGFGAVDGVRSSLVPTTPIKSTYSFVQPELPSPAGRMMAPAQSPMRHASPFVSRYLESPPPLTMMASPVAPRPGHFETRRQCGSKAPYMSRAPPPQWRENYYDRPPPPQQNRERSYVRAPPPQYREFSHERASPPSQMADASASSSNAADAEEEECWD